MSDMNLLENHFYCNRVFKDRNQLFQFAFQQLFAEGYVKETYLQALSVREKEYPTGIETAFNFAMPHAELENVNESTFMVFTLKEPVSFNSMVQPEKSIDVTVVILLVLKEKSEHLSFLTKVMAIFQKDKEVEAILKKDEKSQYEFFKSQFAIEENV
ncbi:MAG: PTS sugar transporter subunit IIA [Erysipelotrichaceae bacterium]